MQPSSFVSLYVFVSNLQVFGPWNAHGQICCCLILLTQRRRRAKCKTSDHRSNLADNTVGGGGGGRGSKSICVLGTLIYGGVKLVRGGKFIWASPQRTNTHKPPLSPTIFMWSFSTLEPRKTIFRQEKILEQRFSPLAPPPPKLRFCFTPRKQPERLGNQVCRHTHVYFVLLLVVHNYDIPYFGIVQKLLALRSAMRFFFGRRLSKISTPTLG